MSFPWAICIAREDASSLAALRLISGIEVAEEENSIWLRGQGGDDQLQVKLATLPAHGRYEWLPPRQLRRVDHRIPGAQLPNLQWLRLDQWLRVEAPTSAMPADVPGTFPLTLVRSPHESDPELLLTNLNELQCFAATAARIRLERLQFAANDQGDVFVRGKPLPSLSGRRFVVRSGIAVPAGFSWEPAVSADVLARRFAVSGQAVAVWNEDGTITRLLGEQFVPLSLSALRATEQTLAEFKGDES